MPDAPDCDPNWVVVPSPNVGIQYDELHAVAAISSSDVWAVGDFGKGNGFLTLVEHWNGSVWSVASSPNVGGIDNFLTGVAAVSASAVRAVGSYAQGGGVYRTLVEHWDGSIWSVVSSPNVGTNSNGLNGVAAVSGSDVRAVGDYSNGTAYQTLVEHWNGSVWSVVSSPNVGTGTFRDSKGLTTSTGLGAHNLGKVEGRAFTPQAGPAFCLASQVHDWLW